MAAFESVAEPRSAHGGNPRPVCVCHALRFPEYIRHCPVGRLQDKESVKALGFSRDKTPTVSSLHEVLKRLDVEVFEEALSEWSQSYLGGKDAMAVDGKGQGGIHGKELPGVYVVAAYAHSLEMVLGQKGCKG